MSSQSDAAVPATTTMTTSTTTIVSAPGKMLIAGGYLVLDPQEIGLVIGVNARFYSSCTMIMMKLAKSDHDDTVKAATITNTDTSATATTAIRVISRQFEQEWNYVWNSFTYTLQEVENGRKKNPFLEKALRIVLLYLHHPNHHHHHHHGDNSSSRSHFPVAEITIQLAGDNDFYSLVPHLQQRQLGKHQIHELPRCLPVAYQDNGDIYKTGLGSSACLVTAVVASVVRSHPHTTTTTNLPSNIDTTVITERLSQIGHCYAQGKVGSGFDVAAAMYGSHIYQRFEPHILTRLLSLLDDTHQDIKETMNVLYQVVHDPDAWKSNLILPMTALASDSFLQVMMADVSGGSESPSMAKQVLQWRAKCVQEQQPPQNADDENSQKIKVPHWDDLSIINRQIIDTLQQIHSIQPTADHERQQLYLDTPSDEWATKMNQPPHLALTTLLVSLKELYVQQRYHMKQMGVAAGNVPIEPDIQTTLCDDVTRNVPGVLATMVPGAGGYDAISILYINHPVVQNDITRYLAQYQPQNVCALTVQGVSYQDGLRVESEFPI